MGMSASKSVVALRACYGSMGLRLTDLQGLLDVVAHEVSHRLRLTAGRSLPTDNTSSTMFTRQHLVRLILHTGLRFASEMMMDTMPFACTSDGRALPAARQQLHGANAWSSSVSWSFEASTTG